MDGLWVPSVRGPTFVTSLLACELSSVATGLLYLAGLMRDRKRERAFCELPLTNGPIFSFRPSWLHEADLCLALPTTPSVLGRYATRPKAGWALCTKDL